MQRAVFEAGPATVPVAAEVLQVDHRVREGLQGTVHFADDLESYMDAPYAKLSIHDGSKVKIAPVHSDFGVALGHCP